MFIFNVYYDVKRCPVKNVKLLFGEETIRSLLIDCVKSDLIFYPGGEGGQNLLPAVQPEQVQREVIHYFIDIYLILHISCFSFLCITQCYIYLYGSLVIYWRMVTVHRDCQDLKRKVLQNHKT